MAELSTHQELSVVRDLLPSTRLLKSTLPNKSIWAVLAIRIGVITFSACQR